MKITTAIWPVPCGVVQKDGRLVLDSDGEESCERALLIAETDYPQGGFVILPAAGTIPKEGVLLSHIMCDYLIEGGGKREFITILSASSFNTFGEALEIVRYLENHPDIDTVIICVKYWHALRCRVLLDFCLNHSRKLESRTIKVKVEACPSDNVTQSSLDKEFFLATPLNMLRMSRANILYTFGLWK